MATKVILKNVRLSFPNLFEAQQYEGQGPFKYRATFLFEPNSESHKLLVKTMNDIAKEEWKDKAATILKAASEDARTKLIGNGDSKTYDGYAGMLFVTATRVQEKGRPLVVDRDKSIVAESDGKVYGGCYVNATVELWPQNNKFGKAIRATLLGVQLSRDGDAFSSVSVGNVDDFEDLSDVGIDDLVG